MPGPGGSHSFLIHSATLCLSIKNNNKIFSFINIVCSSSFKLEKGRYVEDIIFPHVEMNFFIFHCSTRYLTSEHSKPNYERNINCINHSPELVSVSLHSLFFLVYD